MCLATPDAAEGPDMKTIARLFGASRKPGHKSVHAPQSALNNDVTRQFARAGVMFWR